MSDLSAIRQSLADEGLKPTASDEEALRFLWKLYQESDNTFATTLEALEDLRTKPRQEMQEVEEYAAHIRDMCAERDAIIQTLEEENQQLREAMQTSRSSTNASFDGRFVTSAEEESQDKRDIDHLLHEQGLEAFQDATRTEQVVLLLVERARLLDELELLRNDSKLGKEEKEEEEEEEEAEEKREAKQNGTNEEELNPDVSRLQQRVEALRSEAARRRRHIRSKLAAARELLHRRQLAHGAESERLNAEVARLTVRLEESAKAARDMEARLRTLLAANSDLELRLAEQEEVATTERHRALLFEERAERLEADLARHLKLSAPAP